MVVWCIQKPYKKNHTYNYMEKNHSQVTKIRGPSTHVMKNAVPPSPLSQINFHQVVKYEQL